MYLLDTNVISELRKLRRGLAHPSVVAWAKSVSAEELYVSVLTLEELEVGVLRIERRDSYQGAPLRDWLDNAVIPSFENRILPVDLAVARRSAKLQVPNPCPIRDGFIAATAFVHKLTLVTRNVSDFRRAGVPLINPWNRAQDI
jgi:predicted nucleic acid-binding protein